MPEPVMRAVEGMMILSIKVKVFGGLEIFKFEEITHLVQARTIEITYCGIRMPHYAENVTDDGEINCHKCCDLITKKMLRVH